MEERFGHDLGDVRLHTGRLAATSARAIGARAYTVGHDIVFGASEYNPTVKRGQKLLAHELAHVIQQGGSQAHGPIAIQRQADEDDSSWDLMDELVDETDMEEGPSTDESSTDEDMAPLQMARTQGESMGGQSGALEREADTAADAVVGGRSAHVTGRVMGTQLLARKPKAKPKKPAVPQICGRNSTRVADFPLTFISDINVDVTSPTHAVTLGWNGPSAATGMTGPFHSSPGAGVCSVDCDNTATSRTADTDCTPKDGSWPVDYTGCQMKKYPDAKNPTYFQRSGIALHYYPSVPNFPASHGCVRLASLRASQVIHDNSVAGTTKVNVSGTWTRGMRIRGKKSSPVCWPG